MSRLRGLAWLVLLLLLGGLSWSSEHPVRQRTMHNGLLLVEGDFHVHTRFSDGVVSPADVVLLAQDRQLDVVAVTEHNVTFPAKIARLFAELLNSRVLVLVGEEVTSRDAHLLALGIEETVDPRQSVRAVAAEVHAQGGVIAAAHPVKMYWPALEPACDQLDAVERIHPLAFREPQAWGAWSDVVEFQRRCGNPPSLGNSDFHFGPDFAQPRTYLFVESLTREGVLDAIRSGRTVVRDPDGSLFGEERWVRALAVAPEPPALAPRSWARRFVGVVALLLFAGLFATRSRKRAT